MPNILPVQNIIFCGKRIDNGEWVIGDLAHRQINTALCTFIRAYDGGFDNFKEYEVDSSTVSSYTGLPDKYDKKIFAGNIIMWGLKPCVVKWDEDNASFCLYAYGTTKIAGFNRDTMKLKEIIGNIYDNPELLTK